MTSPPTDAPGSTEADSRQKRRLVLGVLVWAAGWGLGLALIPLVSASDFSEGFKAALKGILLVGFPKLFLLIAVAIMGKPGFAYLKKCIAAPFRRLAPPATVSPLRYRIGLILFISLIVLGSLGPYFVDALPIRREYPRLLPLIGDLLLVVSLLILGGDFWDKLRALFVREAKVVFPPKQEG